ncbi:MAG: helix-turn-helix domain-containing protein [Treponema sp.]|jgi:AraC-like DNA-binding protein/ligand-binding sensor protein|nr:helix-turn-helix domain-containing protein [Treponema sp.]
MNDTLASPAPPFRTEAPKFEPFRIGAGTSSSSIIGRRELEPLRLKARELLNFYEKAADCIVQVLGQDGRPLESRHPKDLFFCELCKKYQKDGKVCGKNEYPCTRMHLGAIEESQKVGGSYIYTCDIGFIYWVSPIYSGGRGAGVLISSGVLAIEREKAVENVYRACGGKISRGEVEGYLAEFPRKSYEEVKALAQLMQICADRISGSKEDYMEIRKRIARQESNLSGQIRLIKSHRNTGNAGSGYPLDKERMLLAALRRGDNDAGRKILAELLNILYVTAPGNFEFFQFRAIELVVLLSRAAVSADFSRDKSGNAIDDRAILEANNRYLKKIEDSRNIKELIDILHVIMERLAGKIFSFQGIRHSSALRKAERYIWENYTRKISLQEIANASGLSAPYFSTIFKNEIGENLSSYLNRLRVEKAATMLAETGMTLSEIAAACGFEDQSWFSKIFKSFTGTSPGKYREKGGNYFNPAGGGDLPSIDVS